MGWQLENSLSLSLSFSFSLSRNALHAEKSRIECSRHVSPVDEHRNWQTGGGKARILRMPRSNRSVKRLQSSTLTTLSRINQKPRLRRRGRGVR